MSRLPNINELTELWDLVSAHIEHNTIAARLQSIFRDLSEILKDENRKEAVNIILHYVAAYPAPFSSIAESMNKSRQYIFKVLNREAEQLPWLHELLLQQSQMYYKGDYNKELTKGKQIADRKKAKAEKP